MMHTPFPPPPPSETKEQILNLCNNSIWGDSTDLAWYSAMEAYDTQGWLLTLTECVTSHTVREQSHSA